MVPAIADPQIETVRVFDVKAFEPLAVVVGHRFQAALSEFLFDSSSIPRLDGKPEAFDYRSSRNASGATAVGLRWNGKRLGRRLPENHRAPIANVHHHTRAIVATYPPTHQRRIECGFLQRLRDTEGDMIEPRRPPSCALEYRLDGIRVARWCAIRTDATPLR